MIRSFAHVRTYLVNKDAVTLFSGLRIMRRNLLAQVANIVGSGELHWAGDDMALCVYQGHTFEITSIWQMVQNMLDVAEDMLRSTVLLGISLAELGFDEPDYMTIQDRLDCHENPYSLWCDPENLPLRKLEFSLMHAFSTRTTFTHPFWSASLPDGSPDWHDVQRIQWLNNVGDCALHLAGCTHVWGGQPWRGPEVSGMHNHNAGVCGRNLMKGGLHLIFILGYSKTTSITGKYRMDVHALPPQLSRLFFIMNALFHPLAVQWVNQVNQAGK